MTSCFLLSFSKIPRVYVYDPKKIRRMRNLSQIPRVSPAVEDPKSLVSNDDSTDDELAEELENLLVSDDDSVREKLGGAISC